MRTASRKDNVNPTLSFLFLDAQWGHYMVQCRWLTRVPMLRKCRSQRLLESTSEHEGDGTPNPANTSPPKRKGSRPSAHGVAEGHYPYPPGARPAKVSPPLFFCEKRCCRQGRSPLTPRPGRSIIPTPRFYEVMARYDGEEFEVVNGRDEPGSHVLVS